MIDGNRLMQAQVGKVISKQQRFPGRERDEKLAHSALIGSRFAIGWFAPNEVVMGGWVGGAVGTLK